MIAERGGGRETEVQREEGRGGREIEGERGWERERERGGEREKERERERHTQNDANVCLIGLWLS